MVFLLLSGLLVEDCIKCFFCEAFGLHSEDGLASVRVMIVIDVVLSKNRFDAVKVLWIVIDVVMLWCCAVLCCKPARARSVLIIVSVWIAETLP